MRRKVIAALLCLTVAATGLVGCGSDSKEGKEGKSEFSGETLSILTSAGWMDNRYDETIERFEETYDVTVDLQTIPADQYSDLLQSKLTTDSCADIFWIQSNPFAIESVSLFCRFCSMYASSFCRVWRGIGYCMTIFLAGLQTIPKSLYEAAKIDGANFWQRLRHITIPMLSGAVMINLVFGITYGLKVFDIVYVLTNGGPGHATELMTTYAFQLYSTGNYGMSTALNTIMLVITAVIGVIVVRVMSKKEVQQ